MAELRKQSGLDGVSSADGARALARFNVHCDEAQEMSAPLSTRALKRRERRAPLAPSAGRSLSRVSLALGFSRVVCAANEGNGFNRFPPATTAKPLKRLGRQPHLSTGLKRLPKIASAIITEAKEFVN